MKKDLYKEITDKIIAQLEKGVVPWHKPWIASRSGKEIISHSTGKGYSFLNTMLISRPGEYATFNQIKAEGGSVKKGAKSEQIYFWKMLQVTEKDKNGNEEKKQVPFLQYYNVFNLDDCEGIEPKYLKPVEDKPKIGEGNKRINKAEAVAKAYIKREKISFKEKDEDCAFFRPSTDYVQVPLFECFEKANEYYATLFHELTHSTGVEKRLKRDMKGHFGNKDYSKEELVAECGSAMALSRLGFDIEKTFDNSVAYIKSWLKVLNDDPKMVVSAAGKAEKAVDFIFATEAA